MKLLHWVWWAKIWFQLLGGDGVNPSIMKQWTFKTITMEHSDFLVNPLGLRKGTVIVV